jgi:hypothetical protein
MLDLRARTEHPPHRLPPQCLVDRTDTFQPTWPGAFFSVSSPVTATLRGVWAASSTNAFAVGDRGTIVHWDGSEWTRVDPGIWPPGTEPDLAAVWGSGAENVFAVGDLATILRYDGSSWTQDYTEALTDFTGVWGSAANNVFIVGDDRTGTILHRCGQDW